MMKNKMKNKLCKIMAVIVCMITLVTVLIVPTFADSEYIANDLDYFVLDMTRYHVGDREKLLDHLPLGTNVDVYARYCSDKLQKVIANVEANENGGDLCEVKTFNEIEFLLEYSWYRETSGECMEIFMLHVYLDSVEYYRLYKRVCYPDYDSIGDSTIRPTVERVSYFITGFSDENSTSPQFYAYDWSDTNKGVSIEGSIDMASLKEFTIDVSGLPDGEDNVEVDAVFLMTQMFATTTITPAPTYTEGYYSGFYEGKAVGEENGYAQGYDEGFESAKNYWYDIGYEEGRLIGYDSGYAQGKEDGRVIWYEKGLVDGFNAADTSQAWSNMKNLIFAVFDAPFYVISTSLNFDLFGINIAGTLIALISLAIVVWILKIIVVKFF